jgi:hypothetical protein
MRTAVAIALGSAILFSALSARAVRRVALVIGNDNTPAFQPQLRWQGRL